MIKKIRNLCLIFFASLLLTGCVKYEMDMQINEDKSMDFTLIETMDTSYTNTENEENTDDTILDDSESIEYIEEGSSGVDIDELNKTMGKRGYKVETYVDPNDKNYEGAKITKHFNSIDEISKEGDIIEIDLTKITDEDFNDSVFFSVQKGLVYNVYKANFKILDEDNLLEDSMASMMRLTFSIKLPKGALVESNATTISDDKTVLTWDLKSTEINKINFSFKFAEKSDLYMAYAAIGIIALLIIIAISSAISQKKGNKPKKEKVEKVEKDKKDANVDLMAAPTKNENIDLMAAPTKNENIDLMASPNIESNNNVLHPTEGSGPVINAPSMNMVDNNNQEIVNNQNMMPNLMQDMPVVNAPAMNVMDNNQGVDNNIPNIESVNETPSNGIMPTLVSEQYIEPVKKEEVNNEIEFDVPTIIKPKDTSIIENIEGSAYVHELKDVSQTPMTLEEPPVNPDLNIETLNEPVIPIMPETETSQVNPEIPLQQEEIVNEPVIPVISDNTISQNEPMNINSSVESVISEPIVQINEPIVNMNIEEPVIEEIPAITPSIPQEIPVIPEVPIVPMNEPSVVEDAVMDINIPQAIPAITEEVSNIENSNIEVQMAPIVNQTNDLNYNFDFGAQVVNNTPNPALNQETQFVPNQGINEAADYTNVFGNDFKVNVPVTNIPDLEPEIQTFDNKNNMGPIIADTGETIINQIVEEPIEKQGQ